jgi:hypothetical protein
MATPNRRFFRLGSVVLIAGGVGHLLLVDLATLWTRRAGEFRPHQNVLATTEETTVSWGMLGKTNWFRANAGFSFWLAFSLFLFGLVYLQLARQPHVRLAPFVMFGAVISIAFLVVSATCFIWPPTLGGAIATTLFVASWLRHEA